MTRSEATAQTEIPIYPGIQAALYEHLIRKPSGVYTLRHYGGDISADVWGNTSPGNGGGIVHMGTHFGSKNSFLTAEHLVGNTLVSLNLHYEPTGVVSHIRVTDKASELVRTGRVGSIGNTNYYNPVGVDGNGPFTLKRLEHFLEDFKADPSLTRQLQRVRFPSVTSEEISGLAAEQRALLEQMIVKVPEGLQHFDFTPFFLNDL